MSTQLLSSLRAGGKIYLSNFKKEPSVAEFSRKPLEHICVLSNTAAQDDIDHSSICHVF